MEEQLDKVLLGIYQIDSPVGKLKHNDQESCTVGFMSRLVIERFSETVGKPKLSTVVEKFSFLIHVLRGITFSQHNPF